MLAREPDLAIAHYNLGLALKQKDKLDAAKLEFQKAIERDPSLGACRR